MMRFCILAGMCLQAAVAAAPGKPVRLIIYPQKANLTGDHARQSLLVMAVFADGMEQDVTAKATYTVLRAGSIRVTDSAVEAVAEGSAKLRAAFGGRSAEAEFVVTNLANKRPVSFLGDIAPIMTARGCTGSNCHGSVRGKAGFKLSLFGARPDLDFEAITKSDHGRRLNLAKAEDSLILKKPTMAIPHGGGLRFKADSEQYELIRRWITSGAMYDTGSPKLEAIRVQPAEQILVGADAQQRLIVTGMYADGTVADLTRHVRYSSNDDTTAAVDDNGIVTAK